MVQDRILGADALKRFARITSYNVCYTKLLRTFYWPTLRKVIIGLVNEGIVPQLFAEGEWVERSWYYVGMGYSG